jgi:hypothetical protein
MAFCDGCFELRLDDPVPALLFAACERFLEWPLDLDLGLSSSPTGYLLLLLSNAAPGSRTGEGPRFVDLEVEGDLLWAKSLGPRDESSQALPK